MTDRDEFAAARLEMVRGQIEKRGVTDRRVIQAMQRVPRHRFVPAGYLREAYADTPLPIGKDQTISQPYIVAFMTELLALQGHEKVLEIGTGCGYQTAVLAELAGEVHSIEIIKELHVSARKLLGGLANVRLTRGDGHQGLPGQAPFDRIIVTAAPLRVPAALPEQLADGGRMVIPVGDDIQQLRLIHRGDQGFSSESVLAVRFVPMTGGK